MIVIQNDVGNEFSNTTIVAPITSRPFFNKIPTNVEIDKTDSPLKEKSTILLNQIRTIDKSRIIKTYGRIATRKMKEVDEAIMISLGLD